MRTAASRIILIVCLFWTGVSAAQWLPERDRYPENDRKPRSGEITRAYQAVARQIVTAAMRNNDGYDKLEQLCDGIGHRLSGSRGLERAVQWAADTLRKDGQENVRLQPVMVPHWERGKESLALLSPYEMPLPVLGLGMSVGTPPHGITGEVLAVESKEELDAVASKAAGKIVLFNYAMRDYTPERGTGYGDAVRYRYNGARWAAEHGALACLIRSVTARSLRSPHTGSMSYRDERNRIPAAAVSTEDAGMLSRLYKRGKRPRVRLQMEAEMRGEAQSHNVIAELRGRENPEEVIVIGGHLDSWDVGQGAHDDGAGSVMCMEVLNVLRKLNLIPRRTIRLVLFTNEENGVAGGKAYAKEHKHELANHVAAIESDSGGFAPRGYGVGSKEDDTSAMALQQVAEIIELIDSIPNLKVTSGGGGADINPMRPDGVVMIGHRTNNATYFDYHHTHADTLDKVDPYEFSQNIAVLATLTYIIADMPMRLGTE